MAVLRLEDGRVFQGRGIGHKGITVGEIVFNTSMTGYQEILTDPSYAGQLITLTFPVIGIYGTHDEANESARPWAAGLIVRELSQTPSNFTNQQSLADFMIQHRVIGIEGIDTRALTRHLRDKGAMKAAIGPEDNSALASALESHPSMTGQNLVDEVATREVYTFFDAGPGARRVGVLDCGVKHNSLRILRDLGCTVLVFPASTDAKTLLDARLDGLLISNGPGDPEPVTSVVDTLKALHDKLPLFGICLGHQLLALSLGGSTYKLKFGHRGANHPVRRQDTGAVAMTSQNHGFNVDPSSLDPQTIVATHFNLNDQTLAGLRHIRLPILSVQYHPEAAPGPRDERALFTEFLTMMEKAKAHAAS